MKSGSKIRCYVASPYGFAEGTRYWYQKVLLPMANRYVDILDPWVQDVSHIAAAELSERPALWLDVGDRCYDLVSQSQLVVALLDQEPPDNGTVAEVAWAAAHNIPVIGYRNDLRVDGEEGMTYNLMIGAAIRRSGGTTVTSLDELEAELKRRTSSP